MSSGCCGFNLLWCPKIQMKAVTKLLELGMRNRENSVYEMTQMRPVVYNSLLIIGGNS